jgi:hypothetical protein
MSRRVTPGDRRASPRVTTRTAWISWDGLVSLTRKPLAPARRAVDGFAGDFDVGLCVEEGFEARPDECSSARRTRITGTPGVIYCGVWKVKCWSCCQWQAGGHSEAAVGARPAARRPPTEAARARMPRIPCPSVDLGAATPRPVSVTSMPAASAGPGERDLSTWPPPSPTRSAAEQPHGVLATRASNTKALGLHHPVRSERRRPGPQADGSSDAEVAPAAGGFSGGLGG